MSHATAQTAPGSRRFVQILSALRHRNYRLYWFGQLSSVLAQNMEGVAQSWLALAAPTITLTLLGGVVADRADRRRIMILSQVGSASILLILATLVVAQWIALWHVMTLAFLSGCIRAFDRPSRMALLPQMVPREDIPNAVAVGGTIWQLNRLVGPAVAGMLIYLVGIGPTYYFCFFASLSAVCLWLGIRFQHEPSAIAGGGLLQHMMDGLNFIRKNEIYYTFISMTFFNSVFGMSYLVLMPVFARDVLDVGSQGFGFLQSAGGITFGLLLIIFALSNSYSLSLILACGLGIASQFYITTINAILQVNLPDQLRGRVMGIYGLTWELMPVGGLMAGAIAEYAGAPMAVVVGGAFVAATALGIAVFLPNMRRLEQ